MVGGAIAVPNGVLITTRLLLFSFVPDSLSHIAVAGIPNSTGLIRISYPYSCEVECLFPNILHLYF